MRYNKAIAHMSSGSGSLAVKSADFKSLDPQALWIQVSLRQHAEQATFCVYRE